MMTKLLATSICVVFFLAGALAEERRWIVQTSGIDTNLRSVSIAHNRSARNLPGWAVWASGSNGVILESDYLGKRWARLHVEGGEGLDFRGIVSFSAAKAYIMSSGEGDKSRIYKTANGGQTWKLQYSDNRKEFFLDSIACATEKECLALGDPINGKFLLLKTSDGEHWNPFPPDNMPAALPGEGAFAASNSCLVLRGSEVYLATGGLAARVFHSKDGGFHWAVTETPIAHSSAYSGIFSITLSGEKGIVVVGGDYKNPTRPSEVAAYSLDQGETWLLSERQPGGFRSAVAPLDGSRLVTVGPNGEEISEDGGVHWTQTDSLNLNALAIVDARGWAVGPHGTIAHLVNP